MKQHQFSFRSEANDLALSLARKHTKRQDVAVFESGYHGSLSALNDVSEKTFRQLPQGKKDFVHIIPLPTDSPCGESSYNQGMTLLYALSCSKLQLAGFVARSDKTC